ncbi:galactokinase [[Clostridium] scindens]|uniref:Galactokinase n=2 Tax=Clostridium scindens (strain JCM 10418 / VPI 12708) TaxID=29347 RepID=A0A494WKT9_CLOS5|nr:galactokinase [[Clostridium] scindens]MSS39622.1 galactokinase [[Clostridium] scindens]QBF74317.1 Galactokinase [[Clostridium] scindens ATCC 35704]QRO37564.1 galactokinase [[Clostridium] scindens]WPB21970.1 Galactokinase [[Clostridium] scindens]WPB37028.1 Galactokinase [[Clostridium] scindens]
MKERFIQKFQELYGKGGGIRAYFAPGRVNLIGEHTDYNGGHVFPCALTLGTYGIVRDREDRKLRFYSMNFESLGIIETSLDDLVPDEAANWTNYPKGVMWAFEKRGYKLAHGMDILIYGNIPSGSGLSSSASLEVLTGLMLKDTFGFENLTMVEVALIGQDAENNFNGCNCGIMDQFASAMGKKDHAIFLDTNTLNYEYAPVILKDAKIVITNSKVKHSLVDSAYNDRRNECETALKELQAELPIHSLGELTQEEFELHKEAIKDPVRQRRAKHAVYENQRTIRAVEALRENDVELFGRLMNESHQSLKEDYQVSCREIDILVDMAQAMPGVLGSRITGGGFGGCTVSIVRNDAVDGFISQIGKTYQEKVGHEAEFYVVDIGDGAKII